MGEVGVGGSDEQQARLSLVNLPVEVGGDLEWSRFIMNPGESGFKMAFTSSEYPFEKIRGGT